MRHNPHFITSRAEDAAHASDAMRLARRLTTTLLAVMVIQAVTGLVFQTAYHDIDWIRATWFGNDWVTLVVAVPLLFAGMVRGAAGSIRGLSCGSV
jgi:cation transporter-like permease